MNYYDVVSGIIPACSERLFNITKYVYKNVGGFTIIKLKEFYNEL